MVHLALKQSTWVFLVRRRSNWASYQRCSVLFTDSPIVAFKVHNWSRATEQIIRSVVHLISMPFWIERVDLVNEPTSAWLEWHLLGLLHPTISTRSHRWFNWTQSGLCVQWTIEQWHNQIPVEWLVGWLTLNRYLCPSFVGRLAEDPTLLSWEREVKLSSNSKMISAEFDSQLVVQWGMATINHCGYDAIMSIVRLIHSTRQFPFGLVTIARYLTFDWSLHLSPILDRLI